MKKKTYFLKFQIINQSQGRILAAAFLAGGTNFCEILPWVRICKILLPHLAEYPPLGLELMRKTKSGIADDVH